MSGEVDNRIVKMEFEGESAAAGLKGMLTSLLGLKNALNGLKGSENSLNGISEASKRFSIKGMASDVASVAGKFRTLGIIGVTAIASITNRAISAGISILKSFTIDPIKAGLDVYETKINAIQTILANTSAAGTTLKQVTAALNQLNQYANRTVYNFGQMARNIGTFTAAGVGLKTSVASIKGIANLAALSGSSAEQASTAMYQLSQAIAAGRVKLQDWNSVVNAGLGGKVFQNALIEDARVHGVAIDAMIKKDNGFRNTLQTGWLTSKILTDTLATFTGDLNAHQLEALGYTKAETAAIMKQAQEAVKSATQIRTITQLQAALREEVATAWSQVWEAIIGNIGTASSLLSKVHNTLENAFTNPIKGLASLLNQADKLGARTDIIKGFENAFQALSQILHIVGSAFHEVFPPVTAATILHMAQAFERFTASLKLSSRDAQDFKTILVGVFSVFKIVFDVIGGVFHGLGQLFGVVTKGGGSFLDLAARVAGFVTRVRQAIESGNIFARIFTVIAKILAFPIKAISAIIGGLGGLSGALSRLAHFAEPVVKGIGDAFSHLADAVMAGIKSGNFSAVAGLFNHLLLGGILLSFKHFLGNLIDLTGGSGGGLLDTIKESFEGLTGSLKTMQATLKSSILEKIAISIAILAGSLLLLSLINVKKMVTGLAAITIMMTQLLGALAIVSKVGTSVGVLKMGAIAIALNLLATSIVILSGAVAILSRFSWEQLAKGLAAIAVLLAEIAGAMLLFTADTKGLVASAYAMQVMSVALNILSIAVGRLGQLPISTLLKGIGAIAVLLTIIGGFNAFGGEALIGTATSMVIVGAALLIIGKAVAQLGALPLGTLAKGLLGITLALAVITAAMIAMTEALPGALALIIVAASLVILAKALTSFGGMSWAEIAKAMTVLAVSLTLITAAMILMTEALPGAAALIVVALALAILAPVLVAVGHLSWVEIAKGMAVLAGVFIIFGAAGLLLTPVVPTLIALGLAITLFGVGILAAGAGLLLFGTGLAAIAVAVTASGAAILSFVKSLLSLIPVTLKEIGLGIVAFADAIGNGAAAIANAFTKIFAAIFKQIITLAPLAEKAFEAIVDAFIKAVNNKQQPLTIAFANMIVRLLDDANKYDPKFISAGITLITGFINGIANRIQGVEAAAANLIIAFLNGLSSNGLRIEAAGVDAVLRFINGTANEIRSAGPRLHAAAANLAGAIIDGLTGGIFNGNSSVISAIVSVASGALHAAEHFLGINSPAKKFITVGEMSSLGIGVGAINRSGDVNRSMERVAKGALETLANTLASAGDVVGQNLELNPVITPVIDLTQVKKGIGNVNNLTKPQLIAATSISTARSISATSTAAERAASIISAGGSTVNYTQNNYSPKALDAATVYRKTKSQLSTVKGALASANSSGSN